MSSEGLGTQMKRAFLWHWHLLGLGVGVGFAALSGQPGVFLPFVLAGELAYLGLLGIQPRFQNVLRAGVDVPEHGVTEEGTAVQRYERVLSFLMDEDRQRFEHLQGRCASLLELRRRMDSEDGVGGGEDFRAESLERMLWLCLKLLHQRSGLERFLAATKREHIQQDMDAAQQRLAESKAKDARTGVGESRLTVSISERIRTIGERLLNYDKAVESMELVGSEIAKTEQQITHLCEVGMTMRDSAGLSAQIDSISESLQSSESVFAHASVAGLLDEGGAAPPLLSVPRGRAFQNAAGRQPEAPQQ